MLIEQSSHFFGQLFARIGIDICVFKVQLQLLKLLLEEMKIKFRYEKNENETINSELEEKINEARKEKKEGKLLTIDPKKIWESI